MAQHPARPTFKKPGLFREGYRAEDVDAFLDQLFDAIAAGRPIPDIVTAQFATTRGGGYSMDEVDAFLDELTADLGQVSDPTEQERAQQQRMEDLLQELRGGGPAQP